MRFDDDGTADDNGNDDTSDSDADDDLWPELRVLDLHSNFVSTLDSSLKHAPHV